MLRIIRTFDYKEIASVFNKIILTEACNIFCAFYLKMAWYFWNTHGILDSYWHVPKSLINSLLYSITVLNHKYPDVKEMAHLAFMWFLLIQSKTISLGSPSDSLSDLHHIEEFHFKWPASQQGRGKGSLLGSNQYHHTCIDSLVTKPFAEVQVFLLFECKEFLYFTSHFLLPLFG